MINHMQYTMGAWTLHKPYEYINIEGKPNSFVTNYKAWQQMNELELRGCLHGTVFN